MSAAPDKAFPSVNGDEESRGTKRKAKSDPYDDLDDEDSIPNITPSTQRARSRISSDATSSGTKGRPSSAGKLSKRPNRTSGVRKSAGAEGSRADANANLARAREPQAARLHSQSNGDYTRSSLVPVADMGIPGSAKKIKPAANTRDSSNDAAVEPTDDPIAENDRKGKATATEVAKDEVLNETDEREEHEVKTLIKHRMAQDNSGRVEFLVHWVGEAEEAATWETEEEIQKGAEETLFAYWKAQGGRLNALFLKPKNAPAEVYHVYKILSHNKKTRGGFEFKVQWVGYPSTSNETTMEAEPKLRNIAPEALREYWNSKGGRERHLAKRGRGKKSGSE
ncbi:hypothetical protein GGR53DRAFT_472171 [Hypoxylon sp. FL1150]|nr:hypothetical protein GGR53DRAFT_472171 [Hypoxylon sp. FL1150]